jgi:DNA-binding response OmpR family regulator
MTTFTLAPIDIIPIQGTDLDTLKEIPRLRVLVVDDDPDFINMTKIILCQAGFDVAGADGCNTALEKCPQVNPDVILLDLMMPDVDGRETFRRLRKVTEAPMIMVTAYGNKDCAVDSLVAGFDDYIDKPFYNPEMVARVQAVVRRAKSGDKADLRVFPDIDLQVNFDTHEVVLHGKAIRLVPREYALFSILAAQAPKPVPYADITTKIWGENSANHRSHLKNVAFSLRKKMEVNPEKPKLIINHRSFGYQLITKMSPLQKREEKIHPSSGV